MNLRKHIVLLGILLTAWLTPALGQDQYVVCAGDTGVSYSVVGTVGSTFEWTVSGGEIIRNYGDSIIVDWGIVTGDYEVVVQEISEYGCLSEPKTMLIYVSAPAIELGEDTYICDGESFALDPSGKYYSYLWNDGSTDSTYFTQEEELITLRVSDQYGCYWNDEIYLEVKPLPEVNLGNDTTLCGDQVLYLYGGDDAENYTWSTGENSPEIEVFQGHKVIFVEVSDEFGCFNSDTIVIDDCDPKDYFSDIPTAITPSVIDGKNDVWIVEKLQAYPDAVIDIYDRWGRLIWRSEPGYPTPWDGTNLKGEEVSMDSYHYVMMLNFGDDDRVVGTITVIK